MLFHLSLKITYDNNIVNIMGSVNNLAVMEMKYIFTGICVLVALFLYLKIQEIIKIKTQRECIVYWW